MRTKHPKGLYLLFVTEMWERFSYYGMRAIFTLYLVKAMLLDKDMASNLYGSYTGFVYLTPLIGGYVADRYWGNRRSIFFGGILMAIGQLMLFISASYYTNFDISNIFLYGGLLFLAIGNGFFKPNISTMVGQLYPKNDERKDSAFTIFYMGVNIGAFFSPLVCGALGDTGRPEDFRWGFLMACIGMIIGTFIFKILQNKYIVTSDNQPIGTKPNRSRDLQTKGMETKKNKKDIKKTFMFLLIEGILLSLFLHFGSDLSGACIFSFCITIPLFIITDKSLSMAERKHIWVIFITAFFVIFFWAAFEQAGASLTYFADEQTDRNLFGWEMPASYFQSFNAIFIVLLAPLFSMLWPWLKRRKMEPSSPSKQAYGLLLLAVGYLIIAIGVKDVEPGIKVSMIWLISLYLIHTLGELSLSPIGLSMVNKLSPARFSSLLMGVWFLSTSTANKFAGTLSSLYPEFDQHGQLTQAKTILGFQIDSLCSFFMIFVVMAGIASLFLFIISKKLQKMINAADR
ncbi:MAG: peptide MFS transporter [Paludibacteraceae bacterium]|nr:peptide MFS transporter [Prevotellaceae bacterium]